VAGFYKHGSDSASLLASCTNPAASSREFSRKAVEKSNIPLFNAAHTICTEFIAHSP
jgi:hypothetical protein